jgi:integrase/recombinase XerD
MEEKMIFDYYRADMVGRGIKPLSISAYDGVTRRFQEWCAGQDVRPEEAKFHHVQVWLGQTGWSVSTQHVALAYLRAAYNFAVDMEMLDRNPCRRVRLPRPEQHIPRTIPNRKIREMRRNVRDADDDLLLHLFAFTGLRSVEVRRLTWNDVSMADNELRVFGKGDKHRRVPIHPELRKRLLGRTWRAGSPYVVPGRAGMVSTPGLRYRMRRVTGPGVQHHDFRRSVATSLRANGVDPYVRDAIMGWADGSIFAQHYNYVSSPELQRGILRLFADDPV